MASNLCAQKQKEFIFVRARNLCAACKKIKNRLSFFDSQTFCTIIRAVVMKKKGNEAVCVKGYGKISKKENWNMRQVWNEKKSIGENRERETK